MIGLVYCVREQFLCFVGPFIIQSRTRENSFKWERTALVHKKLETNFQLLTLKVS